MAGIDPRDRDMGANAVDHEHQQRKKDLFTKLDDLPCTFQCFQQLNHLYFSTQRDNLFSRRLAGRYLHCELFGQFTIGENLHAILDPTD